MILQNKKKSSTKFLCRDDFFVSNVTYNTSTAMMPLQTDDMLYPAQLIHFNKYQNKQVGEFHVMLFRLLH